MRIKTLYRTVTAARSVRLVHQEASKPFVVIIDVPHQYVAFGACPQCAEAAACFSSLSGQVKPMPPSQAVVRRIDHG